MTEIPLTRCAVALIDDCDAHLAAFRWHTCHGYAARYTPGSAKERKRIYMHEVIAGRLPGFDVHHKNGRRTDNRRRNLIVTSRSDHLRKHKGDA